MKRGMHVDVDFNSAFSDTEWARIDIMSFSEELGHMITESIQKLYNSIARDSE